MNTKEVIDRIFKDPNTRYELTEFENLGNPRHASNSSSKRRWRHENKTLAAAATPKRTTSVRQAGKEGR